MKETKKILASILTFLLILGLMQVNSMTVLADRTTHSAEDVSIFCYEGKWRDQHGCVLEEGDILSAGMKFENLCGAFS